MPLTYEGKVKIDGQAYLKVRSETWCGWTQRNNSENLLVPENQSVKNENTDFDSVAAFGGHPRHLGAYIEKPGGGFICLSPSLKGFSDIAKRVRWSGIHIRPKREGG